jgi:NADPH-dependent 2,4-dienoyl-CoA reductase/sulfur reductase-like enzyme
MSPDRAVVDLMIVGAGPAGMAAALQARELGLVTLVLDEQPAPGGQIFRNIEGMRESAAASHLGRTYRSGATLAAQFRSCGAAYWPGTLAWNIEAASQCDTPTGWRITTSQAGVTRTVQARRLILATGARERPVPILGWTLPGVLTAGALQIALKTDGMVPSGRFVLAGTGPLLLLLATQLLAAGARPAALLETTPRHRLREALRHLPAAVLAAGELGKGLAMMATLRRQRLPWLHGVTGLAAHGTERLEAVTFQHRGREERIEAELLALHEGVLPDTMASQALGCRHVWDPGQQAVRPVLDRFGDTSVPGVAVAGDGGGIDGAAAAELTGRIAALRAAEALGRVDVAARDRMAAPLLQGLARQRRVRPLLETLYAPALSSSAPADDVVVCRCEEVTAGQIRAALALGAPGPRQVKTFTRCGMGPCQGRFCGPTLARMIATFHGRMPSVQDTLPARFPLRPVTVAELAAEADAATEVMRTS